MNVKTVYGTNNRAPKKLASYFGLTVEIVCTMKHHSLIRWCDHEAIVDTEDLRLVAKRQAA